MAVTSGFYNSLNGDRKYNAEHFTHLFDGIINDGVFATVGNAFKVSTYSGNTVHVDPGKAWFNHAWVENDSILPIDMPEAELLQGRYDAIVIEVDHTDPVRNGTIKVVKGTPSTEAVWPTLTKSERVNQYPIVYIYRPAGSTEITAANIYYQVGQVTCPIVTGPLKVLSIDNIVAQWEAQWDEWYANMTSQTEADAETYFTETKAQFEAWFASLQTILDEDVAASLALRILAIESEMDAFEVPDGSITEAKIADGAVTADKIHATAVYSQHLATDAVNTEHIRSGAIVASKITDGAVTVAKLADDVLIPKNIKAGTLGGKVLANASAVQTYNTKQLRNVLFCTSTANISVANGDIVHVYES